MNEEAIREFWQNHACGDAQVGGLRERFENDYDAFFTAYDEFRYRTERHLLACLDSLPAADADVLEIGLGEGADSEQLIRRGARWSGVDLTEEAVSRVRTRLTHRGLPYTALRQGSVTELPFADNSFDLVFSHGVLHHVPEIELAQKEIHRVLRPGGELVVMVYARRSLNYLVAISLIRRAVLLGAYPLFSAGSLWRPGTPGLLARHIESARAVGLRRYLRMGEFIHHNTDGPANPYSKVYDRRLIDQDFHCFRVSRIYKRFMHAPPLPVHGLPGQAALGWHLWVHLRPT